MRFAKRLSEFKAEARLIARVSIRALREYIVATKWLILGVMVIEVVNTLLPFATAFLTGIGINRLTQAFAHHNLSTHDVLLPFIGAFVATGITFILRPLSQTAQLAANEIVEETVTRRLNYQMVTLDVPLLEKPDFKALVNKSVFRYQYAYQRVMNLGIAMVTNLIAFVTASTLLFNLNPYILLIIFSVSVPGALANIWFNRKIDKIWDLHSTDQQVQSKLSSLHMQSDTSNEIRLNFAYPYLIDVISTYQRRFRKSQNSVRVKESIYITGTTIAEEATRFGIEIWLLLQVIGGVFGIGTYTFYASIVDRFRTATSSFLSNISSIQESSLILRDLFRVFDAKPTIVSPVDAIVLPLGVVPKIEFKNVSFRYPNAEKKVFDNVSFVIEPGEKIALVGPNGAGKSTLIKLLARLYDPSGGAVIIGGHNIRTLDLDVWRSNLGVLLQDFNQYMLSMRDNIEIGRIQERDIDNRLEQSIRQADADSVISNYSAGLEQMLTPVHKDGAVLSGGQWQRIALARTFFRNANVVVLDEPTAAVDSIAEAEIFDSLMKQHEGKTTIIISHRFSTVRRADRIFVLDEGRIIEQGSHDELMKIGDGTYREMFELQAEGYR